MHELGITQEIVAIAAEVAGGAKVRRVVVEIGRLTAVLPDAVRFCFDLCAAGTPVDGALLEIEEIAPLGRCRACSAEQVFERPYGMCVCGHTAFDWLSGEELRVKSIEVH